MLSDLLSELILRAREIAPAELDDESMILSIMNVWPTLMPEDYARCKLHMVATGLVRETENGIKAVEVAQA